MRKILIYCHGYNSSAATDKVQRLRDEGYQVYAWNINVNPDISIPELIDNIDNVLIDHLNQEVQLIFIGTSLGGWYANVLGTVFDAPAICINPAFSPRVQLPTVGASQEVADLYEDAIFGDNDYVVVAKDDEVIDFTNADFSDAFFLTYTETGGHRFNGPEFQIVLDLIETI